MVLNIDTPGRSPRSAWTSSSSSKARGIGSPTTTRSARSVEVKVLKPAFPEIERGSEALIHISEITDERIDDPAQVLEPNPSVRAEVIQMDAAERRIGLSIRSARRQDELTDAQGFRTLRRLARPSAI